MAGGSRRSAGSAPGRQRDLLARQRRGDARLHPRLPLLPCRHLVPAGAGAGGRHRQGRPRAAGLHRLRRALAHVARHQRLHGRRAGHRRDQARAAVAAPVTAIQPGRHGAGGDERRSERASGFDHPGARGGHAAHARHHLQDHHRRDDRAGDRGGLQGRLHVAEDVLHDRPAPRDFAEVQGIVDLAYRAREIGRREVARRAVHRPRLGVQLRAEAAHAVPVGGHVVARPAPRQAGVPAPRDQRPRSCGSRSTTPARRCSRARSAAATRSRAT